MTTEIKLIGPTRYNRRFPPKGAKQGYVARITGRAPGAVKYAREFLGESVTLLDGDDGLYERQIGEKKGGHTRWYHVCLSHPDHGLILSEDCEDELPKIAKLLDDGIAIGDAVEIVDLRPSEQHEGRMVFTAVARTAAEARRAAKSGSVESAVTHCWEALSLLPANEAEQVLDELRAKLTGRVAE